MENQKKLLFCILILSLFAGGCIDELVPVNDEKIMPNADAYEFEAFLSESFENEKLIPTSTFYFSEDESVKVVYIVDNETTIDILPLEDLGSSKEGPVSNVVILGDYSSGTSASKEYFVELVEYVEVSDVNYTISDDVLRGQKHVYINFEQPITGYVAFTVKTPMGQDYLYLTTPPSVVRFVLPEGFTTGNPLIGKASPKPDDVYLDAQDRENIVWANKLGSPTGILKVFQDLSGSNNSKVTEVPQIISIKYYSRSAPLGLGIAAIILGTAAIIVYLRFYSQKKVLAKIRDDIEDQLISPKKKGKN
jgi:hypothetical protein